MRKRRGDAGSFTSGTIRSVWIPQRELVRRDVREASANYISPENTTACRVVGRRRQTWTAYGMCRVLDASDVRSVKTLGARLNFELDFLTFGERLEPVHRDR